MNNASIIEWLRAMGAIAHPKISAGWVNSNCPFGNWRHNNGVSGPDAFGVQVASGVPFVNCFSCGYHGDVNDALLELRHLEKITPSGIPRDFATAQALIDKASDEFELNFDGPSIEEVLNAKTLMHEFPEDWLNSFNPVWGHKIGREYLRYREVPIEVAEALDLRWDASEGRVCFPVRDFKGRLMGLHGRAINAGVEPRYRMYQYQGRTNPLVWLGENWVDVDKPILVVEGPFDLASAVRVYRNTVSPLFANPSFEKIGRMGDCLEVFTLLDRGKAGDLGRARFSKSLPGSKVVNLVPPSSNIKDPGAMSIENLQDLLAAYLSLDEPIW